MEAKRNLMKEIIINEYEGYDLYTTLVQIENTLSIDSEYAQERIWKRISRNKNFEFVARLEEVIQTIYTASEELRLCQIKTGRIGLIPMHLPKNQTHWRDWFFW